MEKSLFNIALILAAAVVGGALSKKARMPEVLGVLLAGIVLGPMLLNVVQYDDNIKLLSNLGVVLLMFLAGLETNFGQFKKAGGSSFLIALFGVAVPLVLGTLGVFLFFDNIAENIFIGIILTATSVSITVETLTELGKLNTKAGINILGAAVIDDVLGLILVSIIIAYSGGGSLLPAMTGVLIFCAVAIAMIIFLPGIINKYLKDIQPGRKLLTVTLSAALVAAFLAEEAGIAAITGAYLCGLLLSQLSHKEYLERNLKAISSGFLSLIFFASVGLEVTLDGFRGEIVIISLVMFAIAVIGKVLGCGFASRITGLSRSESLQVGVGMVSRGEVAIITANIGLQNGIISQDVFIPTIVVVLLTSVITPVLLKVVFSHKVERKLDMQK